MVRPPRRTDAGRKRGCRLTRPAHPPPSRTLPLYRQHHAVPGSYGRLEYICRVLGCQPAAVVQLPKPGKNMAPVPRWVQRPRCLVRTTHHCCCRLCFVGPRFSAVVSRLTVGCVRPSAPLQFIAYYAQALGCPNVVHGNTITQLAATAAVYEQCGSHDDGACTTSPRSLVWR